MTIGGPLPMMVDHTDSHLLWLVFIPGVHYVSTYRYSVAYHDMDGWVVLLCNVAYRWYLDTGLMVSAEGLLGAVSSLMHTGCLHHFN